MDRDSDSSVEATDKSIQQQLADCQPDRDRLRQQVEGLLKDLWTEDLRIVEEILKHDSGVPTPEKTRLFNAYKSRILNNGNSLRRQVPSILADYLIKQVFERTVTVNKLPVGPGPWGLPAGVKHPSERR
jgi:hypothetical protein